MIVIIFVIREHHLVELKVIVIFANINITKLALDMQKICIGLADGSDLVKLF